MKVFLTTANLILTNQGWMSPNDMKKNQRDIKVLTHKDNKWKFVEIVSIEQTLKESPIIMKGHGHPELFLSKNKNSIFSTHYERVWSKEDRKTFRSFMDPKFVKADDMEGRFWASPISIYIQDEKFSPPIDEDLDNFFFIGYYLAIGKKEKDNELMFTCKESFVDDFEALLKRLGIFFKKNRYEGFNEYLISNKKWTEFLLRQFPKTPWKITTPFWLLNASKEAKDALFNGYVAAVGTATDKNQKITTRDKQLAITIKLIAQEAGHSVGLYSGSGSWDDKSWQVVAEESARSSMVMGDFRFGLVREIKEAKAFTMNLWELSLKENSAVVVDGILIL